jgi:hypothetical protein
MMMRVLGCSLFFAVLAGVLTLAVSSAQEPQKDKTESRGARLDVEAIVERLMAFDKNKDGKLTRDELPERLHYLFEKGDLNKDGALDKDEIRKLASIPGILGENSHVSGGREGGAVNLERVIDDLGVRGEKRQKARAAVQAHQAAVRAFMEKSQAELLDKMKGLLNDEEFKEFKAAVERQQRPGGEGSRGRDGEPKRDRVEKKQQLPASRLNDSPPQIEMRGGTATELKLPEFGIRGGGLPCSAALLARQGRHHLGVLRCDD